MKFMLKITMLNYDVAIDANTEYARGSVFSSCKILPYLKLGQNSIIIQAIVIRTITNN